MRVVAMKKRSRINLIYRHMKQRCYNPRCKDYKDYGNRGILICSEWMNPERVPSLDNATKGYLAFKTWAISNGYSDDLTIDRIDVNKGYSPSNCRWVSNKVQQNNKRTNKYLTYKGRTKSLSEWCEELGLNYSRVKARINVCKWSVEQAFETKEPLRLRRKMGGMGL